MTVQHRLPPGKYRLTADDFLRLDEAGVFGTDRTELLGGDIIIMNAEHRPHAWAVGELGYLIRRELEAAESELHVMTGSVAVSDHDVPLPDIVLTREPRGNGPIPAASVGLIVEVASSTLRRDLGDKLAIYAGIGVPEYWVVDLNGRCVHQMWAPTGDIYSERRQLPIGERVVAATVERLVLNTSLL